MIPEKAVYVAKRKSYTTPQITLFPLKQQSALMQGSYTHTLGMQDLDIDHNA